MESTNPDFLSPKFKDRPIILSPPPVEQAPGTFALNMGDQQIPINYQRNQSVGYNLQQEFEALKADLDLDLSNSNLGDSMNANDISSTTAPSSTNMAQSGSRVLSGGPSLLSPSASHHGYLGSSLSDNLLRDSGMSQGGGAAASAGSNPGLHALLNNKSTGFLPPLSQVPSRPQSVNDFSNLMSRQKTTSQFLRLQPSNNFYPDMLAFTSWIENLNPQDVVTMLDYWCGNLPFDILLTMKSKLESHLHQGSQVQPVFNKVANYGPYLSDFVADMDSMSLGENLRPANSGLAQPKPKVNAFKSHLFADSKIQRPKLADPSLHNRFPQNLVHQNQMDRARSPTSHLYEKTSFLQLAAASSNSMHNQNLLVSSTSEEGLDLSATSKLGALATINSRVALDSNRKIHQVTGQSRTHPALGYEESINRTLNSSSVPAVNSQKYSMAASGGPSVSGIKVRKDAESPKAKPASDNNGSSGTSSMPSEIASIDLLNNIPAWLKLLRLHKYTDCLKDIHWRELVELDDQQLEDKGVKALGARRKLLKAFDVVKQVRT